MSQQLDNCVYQPAQIKLEETLPDGEVDRKINVRLSIAHVFNKQHDYLFVMCSVTVCTLKVIRVCRFAGSCRSLRNLFDSALSGHDTVRF